MIYPSIYAGPPRWYGSTRTVKRYIAIHNTSNDATAEGEASYAKRREDRVSSQYYCDDNSLLQSLDTALRAYHAGSSTGNSLAIAYEITGTNGKSRAWWLANVAWPLLARQIAADCREFGIAARLLTVDEIKAGKLTGIITHDQMRQAWGGTTHTDPGPNFPLDYLLTLVAVELNGDDMNWDDKIGGTANPNRTFRQVFQDLSNDRDYRVGDSTAKPYNPPAANSRTVKADAAADKTLTQPPVQAAPVDPAALKAVLMDPEVLAAIAKAVADEDHARSAG